VRLHPNALACVSMISPLFWCHVVVNHDMAYHADVRILRISLPFEHCVFHDHAFSVKIQGICNFQIPCITLHIVFVSPKLISLYVLELECCVIATQTDSNNMHFCGDSPLIILIVCTSCMPDQYPRPLTIFGVVKFYVDILSLP